jgi:hypothetical protein
VALNFTAAARRLDGAAAGLPDSGTLELSIDSGRAVGLPVSLRSLRLGPNEGVVIALRPGGVGRRRPSP